MASKEAQDSLGLKEFLSAKPEVEVEAKAESPKADKPEVETARPERLDTDAEKAVERPVQAKADVKPARSEAKVDGPNWDDDTNPWKSKAAEYEKRYKDTHRWGNEVNQKFIAAQQQQAELQRQYAIINDKLDGTYDPAKYEAPAVDPVQHRQWGTLEGKVQASLAAAKRTHGDDVVLKALERYAEVFKNDPSVQQANLNSDDPIQGAIDAVEAHDFYSTYGNNPKAILAKLKAEFEANEAPKIRESLRLEAMGKTQSREPGGIGNVQGGSGAMDAGISKDNKGRRKSLAQIVGN